MAGDALRALAVVCSQADFAELIGVSEAKVSQMLTEGVLERGATQLQWLRAYCARLREQAAGRDATGQLTQERAALAREQRVGQEIKNRVAQGEYAPVGLLADVLAAASAGVVDRFDTLPGLLRKTCPDLPSEAREAVMRVMTSARNEWVRATAELAVRALDELAEVDEDQAPADADVGETDEGVPTE